MDTADDEVRLQVVVNSERPPADRRQDTVFYKPRSEKAVHQNDSTRKDYLVGAIRMDRVG